MRRRSLALLAAVLVAAACAETDRGSYPAGASGSVEFRNATRVPLYLAGCSHFEYEKQVGERWVSQGPAVVCVWEGFAQEVAPGAAVTEPIEAREPGRWRLRYPVGIGCSRHAPLSEAACRAVGSITSNEFEVLDSGCVVSGCSGQICAERPYATTCEWRPEYACYREARCGRYGPGDTCAWEPTPELLACLADPPALGW
ncbi:MAG: hypothetical protein OZ948_02540 [Deltaproteobacteria bacterium]|nr:hypothetical protein [Deltaproteobacteria bacterium]